MGGTMALSLANAQLISLFIESCVYGLFVATFVLCIRALVWTGTRWTPLRAIRWWLLVVAIAMFAISTIDVAVLFWHVLQGFVFYQGLDGPGAYFTQHMSAGWVNIVKGLTLATQQILVDTVLIYRCYTVYNRSWKIILLPIVVEIGITLCGYAVPYLEASTSAVNVTAHDIDVWIISGIILAVVQTTSLNVLICRRLWKFAKFNAVAYANPSSPRLQTPLFAAMVILVESGVLLSAGAIAMLGATLANNLSIYPISDAMTPLLGIGFNLIVIRVNAQRQETLGSGPEPEGVGAYPLQFRPSRSPLESQSQGVHVSVTRDVNFDSEALRVGGAHKPGDSGKWKP